MQRRQLRLVLAVVVACSSSGGHHYGASASTIVACAPSDLQPGDLLKFMQHTTSERPRPPSCGSGTTLVTLDAATMDLASWNVGLLRLLLSRRRMTQEERKRIKSGALVGSRYAHHGANYEVLKHALHEAVHEPDFLRLAEQRRGMWLEFGVLTGLSINITATYLESICAKDCAKDAVVDGFDTFTGLPEAWPNGKGGFYYKAGTFSWAARKKGPTPPVKSRVRLHTGLFNNTLPPFLQQGEASANRHRPLAWTNIDCDLYGGTVDALTNLRGRLCPGTRIHFHELLKDRYWKARHLEKGNVKAVVASEEARALYEFLRDEAKGVKEGAGVQLELGDVVSQVNSDAAVFAVRRATREAAAAGVCGEAA